MSNPHLAVGPSEASAAITSKIRIVRPTHATGVAAAGLRRLRPPPPTPPSNGGKLTMAPDYDSRDILWIREVELGAVLVGLDASRVTCYAVVGKQATAIESEAIPGSAQLLIARGPLRHEAGTLLTIKSAETQQILFSGELRYPIDLEPDGSVLLLLASPSEEGNKALTSTQIYTGRIVSPAVAEELRQHIRRELPPGEELLGPMPAP